MPCRPARSSTIARSRCRAGCRTAIAGAGVEVEAREERGAQAGVVHQRVAVLDRELRDAACCADTKASSFSIAGSACLTSVVGRRTPRWSAAHAGDLRHRRVDLVERAQADVRRRRGTIRAAAQVERRRVGDARWCGRRARRRSGRTRRARGPFSSAMTVPTRDSCWPARRVVGTVDDRVSSVRVGLADVRLGAVHADADALDRDAGPASPSASRLMKVGLLNR